MTPRYAPQPFATAQRGQWSVLRISIVLCVADLNRWQKMKALALSFATAVGLASAVALALGVFVILNTKGPGVVYILPAFLFAGWVISFPPALVIASVFLYTVARWLKTPAFMRECEVAIIVSFFVLLCATAIFVWRIYEGAEPVATALPGQSSVCGSALSSA